MLTVDLHVESACKHFPCVAPPIKCVRTWRLVILQISPLRFLKGRWNENFEFLKIFLILCLCSGLSNHLTFVLIYKNNFQKQNIESWENAAKWAPDLLNLVTSHGVFWRLKEEFGLLAWFSFFERVVINLMAFQREESDMSLDVSLSATTFKRHYPVGRHVVAAPGIIIFAATVAI